MSTVPENDFVRVLIRDGICPTPDLFGTSRQIEVEIKSGDLGDLDRASAQATAKVAELLGKPASKAVKPPAKVKEVASPQPESPATSAPEVSSAEATAPKDAAAPSLTEAAEDWECAVEDGPAPITDEDLTSACAKANVRLGGQPAAAPAKIKAVVAKYIPAGQQGLVANIFAEQRQAFLDELAALS